MGNTDKNTDKNADEIIQETMKEIYDDLDKENVFEEKEQPEEEGSLDADLNTEETEEPEEEDFLDEEDEETDEEDFLDEEDFSGAVETDGSQDEEDPETESEEEEEEETEEEKAYRKHKFRKKLAIILGSIVGVIVLVYLGFALFFSSHFMFFTTINGTDVTLKSVSQVEEYMRRQVADYTLTLEESDGGTEQIVGADISLEYVPGDELQKLVKGQENFLWLKTLWDHPEFNGTQFEIVPEVVGTQINTEVFNEAIRTSIGGFQHTMNLTETGSYIQPAFVEDSPEVIAANDAMNSYLKAQITYDFNPNTEVVNAAVISQWVTVNDKMEVTFNTDAVKQYIQSLADKYNTKGKSRQFTTATGNTVTVEGGSYGWRIDQDAEYEALIANIQNGETVTREPSYSSRGASHGAIDIGTTYAEVDLTNQRAYFIKDGAVVLDSPIVTGNPNKGNATPQGTYSLSYKTRNAVLRGDRLPDGSYTYESPVKYWMPFNGGIGFHDASWQASFGGDRYKSHGSHGCVNMPTDQAAKMYDLISDGTPVVCHY